MSPRRQKGSGSTIHFDPKRGRYWAQFTQADGSRKTLYGKTERDVERAREDAVRAVETGIPVPGDRLKLGDFLDDWLVGVEVNPHIKRGTYRSYEGHVRVHLKPALGREPLARLGVDRVQRFVNAQLKAGHSPRLVEMMRAVLRIALSEAQRRGLVAHNVAKLVRVSVRDGSRVGHALTPEQTSHLLDAAQGQRSAPLFALLVSTGLRLGEALALRWSDVDMSGGWLHVRHTLEKLPREPWRLVPPKTRQSQRQVPLVPVALEALRQQQDRQRFERGRVGDEVWLGTELVFANERGDATAQRGVQDAFKLALERAGLEQSHRIHDLRHSTATYLHMLGIDQVTIMAILGHSTLAMTQRYAHVQRAMLEDAKSRLATLFAPREASV